MRTIRKIALWVSVVLVALLLVAAAAKWYWDAHVYDGYDPGAPLNAVIRGEEAREGYTRIDLTFDGLPGMAVPTLLALPADAEAPYPCVVFLHGIGQDKRFLDEIVAPFASKGYAMASFDQYTRGERKMPDKGPIADLFAMRRRAALNAIETRRLVDYLLTRPDIDPDHVYLVGASFGAITGTAAAAFEPRIRAVVLTYGGGNIRKLFSSEEMKKELGSWHWLVREVAAFTMAPIDPVRHVRAISPRPILIQNGDHDCLIPNESAQALHDAAHEPKTVVWYDTDHIGLDREHVMRVLNETILWFEQIEN